MKTILILLAVAAVAVLGYVGYVVEQGLTFNTRVGTEMITNALNGKN